MSTKQLLLERWQPYGVDSAILDAFARVPREHFILDPVLREQAYRDIALPTVREQSLSQPTTVVMMLQALAVKPGQKVFEIGAGVGYNAALLNTLVGDQGKVITTEIIPELVAIARKQLQTFHCKNTTVLEAEGCTIIHEHAPFDRIIVTAACPVIPQPLLDALKEGGIIVAPIGNKEEQTLVKGTKKRVGVDFEFLGPFTFVPLQGKWGFSEETTVE